VCVITSKYRVITNDVSDYINLLVRIAHIICNHPLCQRGSIQYHVHVCICHSESDEVVHVSSICHYRPTAHASHLLSSLSILVQRQGYIFVFGRCPFRISAESRLTSCTSLVSWDFSDECWGRTLKQVGSAPLRSPNMTVFPSYITLHNLHLKQCR
jgi:hypothetical protein